MVKIIIGVIYFLIGIRAIATIAKYEQLTKNYLMKVVVTLGIIIVASGLMFIIVAL